MRIVNEIMRADRPIGKDVIHLYRVRYTVDETTNDYEQLTDADYKGWYGGFNDAWKEFQPFEMFDTTFEGVLTLDGRWMFAFAEMMEEAYDLEYWEKIHAKMGEVLADSAD